MATSRTKAKGKLKKRIGRLAKMKIGSKETSEAENSDLSQLRTPIDTSLSSLKQIAQLLENGSDEVRDILTYECDVIYECRICRSLFRSLANLISHKRVYCMEKYGVKSRKYSMDSGDSASYKNNCSDKRILADIDYINSCNDRILRSQAGRKAPKKDLTSVVEMLTRKQNNDFQSDDMYDEMRSACPLRITTDDNQQVVLEIMDSNKAAYQTILTPDTSLSSNGDLMKTQTAELKDMSNRSTAVLGPDGQFHEINSNVTRYGSNDEDDFDFDTNDRNSTSGEDLTCATCNTKFATKKTLRFHVKCKHMMHRICFPCPCCSSIFTNRWSVYRHLFKVHRKSNEQVRRLRSQIQARASQRDITRMENTSNLSATMYRQVMEQTENLVVAQDWMENLDLDTELQRCGACGKRFDRRASLISHSEICKERGRVNARKELTGRHKRASKNPPQRIEKIIDSPEVNSIERDRTSTIGAKIEEPPLSSVASERENSKTLVPRRPSAPIVAIVSEPPKETAEIAIRVEDVSSLSKDAWDMIGTDNFSISPECAREAKSRKSLAPENSDIPEVIYTSIDNSRPVALSVLGTEKKLGIQYRGIRLPTVTLEKINIGRDKSEASSQKTAISFKTPTYGSKSPQLVKKESSLVNRRQLQCLPCNRKFVSLLNLRRHNAVHQRRSRYRCKLCDFKAFLKCDCIAHCNKKHNARNNRTILSELIVEMSIGNDSSDSEKSRATEVNDETRKRNELEVIDVPSVIPSAKMRAKPANTDPRENQDGNENNNSSSDRRAPPPETLQNNTLTKEKPRRGRPPKSREVRKRRAKRRVNVKKMRHVSPPKLNEDLSESEEIGKVAINKSIAENGELSRFRAPSRMDCDPELRKMVMEVIFGPAEKTRNLDDTDVIVENEKIKDEQPLLTKPLDHRESCELLPLRGKRNESEERKSSWQTEIDERENMMLCDRVNLANSNTRDDRKNVTFRKNVSTPRIPIILARKTPTNARLVQFHDTAPSNGVHRDSVLSSTPETLSVIACKRINEMSTDTRQSDVPVTQER